jgi:hypothetical protein
MSSGFRSASDSGGTLRTKINNVQQFLMEPATFSQVSSQTRRTKPGFAHGNALSVNILGEP